MCVDLIRNEHFTRCNNAGQTGEGNVAAVFEKKKVFVLFEHFESLKAVLSL